MGIPNVATKNRPWRVLWLLPLLLSACAQEKETQSWKAVGWHYAFPAEGVNGQQAISELQSRLLTLGFTPEGPPIAAGDKIFARSYNADASTVRVGLSNLDDPKCFSVTVFIGEGSEDLPRARDVESAYLHSLRDIPGWRVTDGGCVVVDDNGQPIRSLQEVKRARRVPGPDDKLQ